MKNSTEFLKPGDLEKATRRAEKVLKFCANRFGDKSLENDFYLLKVYKVLKQNFSQRLQSQ